MLSTPTTLQRLHRTNITMKRILILLGTLAAVAVSAQLVTALTCTVRVTGTPTTDDRRTMRWLVDQENSQRSASGDTNLLASDTVSALRTSTEIVLSNTVARAWASYQQQAAASVETRLTRDEWQAIRAAIIDKLAAGGAVSNIIDGLK